MVTKKKVFGDKVSVSSTIPCGLEVFGEPAGGWLCTKHCATENYAQRDTANQQGEVDSGANSPSNQKKCHAIIGLM